jgi:tetratricopeptide (TPR) repeat protein
MKPVIKLKDDARKHELKEDWEKAIQVYLQVVRVGEQGEADLELPLYNRIGDLYVRLGRPADAVSFYAQAADRYAEAGLHNNAIALCNKALRYAPDNLAVIRKLGQFSASQGFLTDARRWFVEFAERASKQGQVDEALSALEDFANISDDADVREMLGRRFHQHGRQTEAVNELRRAYGMYLRGGEQERADAVRTLLLEIDPDVDLETIAEAPRPSQAHDPALEALPAYADAPTDVEPVESAPLEGFEATHIDEAAAATDMALAGLEPTAAEPEEPDEVDAGVGDLGVVDTTPVAEVDALEGFQATSFETAPEDLVAGGDEADLGFELPALDEADADFELPLLGDEEDEDVAFELPTLDEADEADEVDLPLLEEDGAVELAAEPPAEVRLEEPEEDVLAPAREAVAAGDVAAGTVALGVLQGRLTGRAGFGEAAELAARLLERAPDEVRLHQLRVEFIEQAEDTAMRLRAYLDLAAALERTHAPNKAHAMYQHVLDIDPGNTTALAALGMVVEAQQPATDYVDLASLLDVEEQSGDTRYFVEEKEPTGDEDRDFAELLTQFKAKVSEHVSAEDAGAHYDLGLAFKEMGLVDEAIAEFQVALRAGDERLKIYEELGQCFMMKEQYNVATKVFGRALRMPHEDDLELIGVYYHMGRAFEELGQPADARDAYERVLTLDINFQDVSRRLSRL